MSIFKKQSKSHLDQPMFFGDPVDIQRYDKVKYKQFEAFTEKMLGFFWRPQESDLSKDFIDFKKLTDVEKHIFTSNLKRQILLDSIQGRAPTAAFAPYTSIPELEAMFTTWAFFETIHSRSYTHIIRNVYANPSEVFDTMLDIPEITECADEITKYYDALINMTDQATKKEYCRALYLAMVACNVLEGVRFYVSFACSWAFAETKRMDGNANIIKLICRDENIHLAASTAILKQLPKEDPIYAEIREETRDEVHKMFQTAMDQEKAWADYLFRGGSMIGLNAALLKDYVNWIGNKRMKALGYEAAPVSNSNPLPWTEAWIGAGNVQAAPQETEITDYVIGGIKNDLRAHDFSNIEL